MVDFKKWALIRLACKWIIAYWVGLRLGRLSIESVLVGLVIVGSIMIGLKLLHGLIGKGRMIRELHSQ